MKLAISNIAWLPQEAPQILSLMERLAIKGLEVSPTLLLGDLEQVTPDKARQVRHQYKDAGIGIISIQSLLFGHPEWNLFGDQSTREKMTSHLRKVIEIGGWLGAGVLVFGSPKNRRAGGLSKDEAQKRAADFFLPLAEQATQHGTCLCIEANPSAYDCDFINTTLEALELVKRVGKPGFGLHLDAGAMTMNREPYEETLRKTLPHAKHFHISEPFLKKITERRTDHPKLAALLGSLGYKGWVSIEMLQGQGPSNLAIVEECLLYAKKTYGAG